MKKKIVYAIEGIQQISVIIIFLLLYSCASIKPVKPNLPTTRIVVPEPEKSRLKIPITINVNALVNRLDSNILRSIDNKDKWECEGNNCIEYKIDMDDLGVTINGNILSVNTKLKYQVSYGRKLFGKIQSLASSGEQTLNVGFNSGLTWNNDWTLSTKTSLIPVTGSDVYISEFNYNVTRVIISGLQHSLEEKITDIDKQSGQYFNVRTMVENMWNIIQAPIKVHNQVWFALNPDSISVSKVRGKNN